MAAGLIISLETIRNTHPEEYPTLARLPYTNGTVLCLGISWIDMKNLDVTLL